VAALLNEEPMTQTTVLKWLSHPERQPPARMFAIERALALPPGYLTRDLGYLPAGVVAAPPTVEQAIAHDATLTAYTRTLLLAAYEAMTAAVAEAHSTGLATNGHG
jgi:hypothetical protein